MYKIKTKKRTSSLKSQSIYTTVVTKLGLHKLRWSLRRLNVPISNADLVLEVGSGGNPYPRANVLLDAYEETRERHWEALVHDRPTVLSFGENLPFKDKSFDYVIAAHVLEHTPYPEKFLAELQRVAKAGYIETPDAFMERINPYKDHRLEVTVRDKGLVIRKNRLGFMMRTWLSFMKNVPSRLLPVKPYRSMQLSFTCVILAKSHQLQYC